MKWLQKMMGVDKMEERVAAAEASLAEANARLDAKKIEEETPRIDIKGDGIGPDGQARLELDWNDAFIKHLKEHGYTGETEEDIVNMYLNSIMMRHARPEMVTNGIGQLESERNDLENQ